MPSILIQDITPRNQYTAAAAQTVFIYSFTLFDEHDIQVYKRTSAATMADDYSQKLQLNIDYTVNTIASTITLLVACSGNEIVTLVRDMPDERLNLYTNGTVITADALNTDQESSVLLIQQNSMFDTVLAPHYNKSEIIDDANPLGGDTILPRLPASHIWIKDPTDNFITTTTLPGSSDTIVFTGVAGTGSNNQLTVWSGPQTITFRTIEVDNSNNFINVNSISFEDIQIAVVDSHTINTINSKDLSLQAAATKSVILASTNNQVTISGLNYPKVDGTAGYFITTDGAGNLSFAAGGGGAPFASTKYNLVQFSNTTGGLQDSGIDYQAGVLSGPSEIDVANLKLSGNTLASTNANGNINFTPNGSGVNVSSAALQIKSGNALQFYRTSNAFYTAFKAGSPGANVTWTLPDADGALNEVLTTDGAGTLSWTAGGGGGGGSSNLVQTIYTNTAGLINSSGDLPGGITVTITPSSNTSRIKITVNGGGIHSVSAGNLYIKRNSALIPISSLYAYISRNNASFGTYVDSPGTTSPVTYTLYMGNQQSGSISSEVWTLDNYSVTGLIAEDVGTFGGGGSLVANNIIQTVYSTAAGAPTGSAALPGGTDVTITPSSATSRVRLTLNGSGFQNSTARIYVKRNGSFITVGSTRACLGRPQESFGAYIDSPATTSAVTYSLYAGVPANGDPTSGFWYFDDYCMITFIAEEVGP